MRYMLPYYAIFKVQVPVTYTVQNVLIYAALPVFRAYFRISP